MASWTAVQGVPRAEAEDQNRQESAYSLWVEALESTLTGREVELRISGTNEVITFGAEKEGSSALITRVMGPNRDSLKAWVLEMPEEQRKLFLREFLSSWARGSIRVREVRDVAGAPMDFDFSFLKEVDYASADLATLQSRFEQWLDKAGDRSFSFISESARMRLFKGTFLAGQSLPKLVDRNYSSSLKYKNWVPLYGEPEKYIDSLDRTSIGWEIKFKPQRSYALFERMIDWFRSALENAGERFEAPGHQRMVMPQRPDMNPSARLKMERQLAELYRNVEAYILLRGMAGMSGIEVSRHKAILNDLLLKNLKTGRGVIRLERDRFVEDSYGIELRAGTKTDYTRRFIELLIGTRYAANDFKGIASISDWTLLPSAGGTSEHKIDLGPPGEVAARFGVSYETVVKARDNITNAKRFQRSSERSVEIDYVVPLWFWENAPYLTATKKAHLKELTRTFLESVASWQEPSVANIQEALATWVKASHLIEDVEAYLRPRAPPLRGEALGRIFEYRPTDSRPGQIDVNKIDLGIEYSARFPIKLESRMSDMRLQDGKFAWLETYYDLTPQERESLLEGFSRTLGQTLNQGRFTRVRKDQGGGHGHQFVLAYELQDRQGRTWRVEWDGVGRSYDPDGNVIDGSLRGGHIEVVTPKFNPTPEEVNAVFTAFAKHNLLPLPMGGGGHINIDLAPFGGNPRALARFLTIFHEHRGVIALLFQHLDRLKSAEPIELSPALVRQLRDYAGNETELKQLLFNERYFNMRLGRKSRYLQLDVSSYFQDVVPSHLITRDFDLMNDLWRPAFNVDPRIRKMEFRLFDSPRNEIEAALQVKLVRAMLHQALNETTPLSGSVQKVDYEAYLKEPDKAFADLAKLGQALGLDPAEYRPMLVEGLASARDVLGRQGYRPLPERLAPNPVVREGWGRAVAPRPAAGALASEDHPWNGDPLAEAVAFNEKRRQANDEAERLRAQIQARRAEGSRKGVVSRLDCLAREMEEALSDSTVAGP